VVTGPYHIALSEPAQRIWDLRTDWWAAKVGFHPLPQVERLIFLPYMEEHQRVQNLLANNLDTCLELRPANIITLLEQHPKMSTWTGRESPYSYMTPWAITLGFNNTEEPFSDPEIRRAINYAIDREQLVEIGWQNSGDYALLPLPDVPQMQPYLAAAEDLVKKYEVGVHDTTRTAAILRGKGWARGTGDYWEKDGEIFSITIDIFAHFQDLTPILVAQLKKAGFDASFRMTSDYISRMAQGQARAFIFGNLSSMRDPYQC
jgi:peptide/nickel transport system substrate-binding protein